MAAAIDRYVQVDLVPLTTLTIEFALAGYQLPITHMDAEDFWLSVDQLDSHYQDFLQGKRPVTEITTHLHDLPLYALGLFLRHLKIPLTQGIRLTIGGDLPMGYGLGSSAAVVVGIIRVASLFFQRSLPLSDMLILAKQVEHLQHGQSSGIDPSACLHEGVILYRADPQSPITSRPIAPWPAYLVNTGQPMSTTGECVAHVQAQQFGENIWNEFTAVTLACDQALATQDSQQLHKAIAHNHQLLCHLGVVPERIQQFIAQLEFAGGAAKICGAGSIAGDNGGYLLALPGAANIQSIIQEFRFGLELAQLGVVVNH